MKWLIDINHNEHVLTQRTYLCHVDTHIVGASKERIFERTNMLKCAYTLTNTLNNSDKGNVSYAPITQFRAPTSFILFGSPLNDVKEMEASILAHGLLSPLRVTIHKNRLIVIDGRKRLAALRRLQFRGSLPRRLQTIPYITNTPKTAKPLAALVNGRQVYNQIIRLRQQAMSINEIAAQLYLPRETIADILRVKFLSPTLKSAFFNDNLSLPQIKAFSALPSHDAQDALLISLGPFAEAEDILKAVERGETVLSLPDDNVILLPSRNLGTERANNDEQHAA